MRCETRVFALPMNSGYTAISYAWGPPVAEHAILLNGREHLVATNLWHLLNTWRRHSNPFRIRTKEKRGQYALSRWEKLYPDQYPNRMSRDSWLWIDALSIDQNNMQERSHQVKSMSRIFGGADEVVVWLGPASTETDRGRVSLKVLAKAALDKGPVIRTWHGICDRVYWTRLWIFQELKSAKCVMLMCGDEMIWWAELVAAFLALEPGTAKLIDLLESSAASNMVALCGRTTPTSLWLLIQFTQELHCYDPYDKIYALLSIATSGHDGIDADYSIPLPQVMSRVLSNSHLMSQTPSADEVNIHCARFKVAMGIEPGYPWGADDYFATERLAHPLPDSTLRRGSMHPTTVESTGTLAKKFCAVSMEARSDACRSKEDIDSIVGRRSLGDFVRDQPGKQWQQASK